MEFSDVFISYRRKDIDFAKKLDKALKATGREVWVDWEDIPPGVEGFGDEIQKGIAGTNALIAVLSPGYIESEYCIMELRHALKLKKRIIPVVCQKFDPHPAPEGIGHINWIYFTPHAGQENPFGEAFQKVVDALEADYEYSSSHTHELLRAMDWEKNQRNNGYLLKGAELEKAERWQVNATGKSPAPTELQAEHIFASRKNQQQQQRTITLTIGFLLILAIAAAGFAGYQANMARIAAELAQSNALASAALQPGNEKIGIALALEATRGKNASPEAYKALAQLAYPAGGIRYHHHPLPDENYTNIFYPAFSPDGQYAVLNNRLYDLTSDTLVREFKNTPGYVLVGAFLPDGKRVILAGDDKSVQDPNAQPVLMGLYDVATGELILKYDTGIGIQDIQLSGDSKTLIGYQPDGKAAWWDVESGKKLREFALENTPLPVSFSPDLRWLAEFQQIGDPATNQTEQLVILDSQTLTAQVTIPFDTLSDPRDVQLRFNPNSSEIAISRNDGVELYNTTTGVLSAKLTDQASCCFKSIRYRQDGMGLVAATRDHQVILWRSAPWGWNAFKPTNLYTEGVLFAEFVADDQRIVSMEDSGQVLEWDIQPGNLDIHVKNERASEWVSEGAISPDGQSLLLVIEDEKKTDLVTRDANTLGEKSRISLLEKQTPYDMPGGFAYYLKNGIERGLISYVIQTETASTVYVRALSDGHILREWPGIADAEFLPDGENMLVHYWDDKDLNHIEIRNISTGQIISNLTPVALSGWIQYSLSPDGTWLAIFTEEYDEEGNKLSESNSIVDTANGNTLLLLPNNLNLGMIMPDENHLFTTDEIVLANATQLSVWNLDSGEKKREFPITRASMGIYQSAPDGRFLFTSAPSMSGGGGTLTFPSGISRDFAVFMIGNLKQWDFQTGELVWEFPLTADTISFSADGSHMLTTSLGEGANIWRMDSNEQLVVWACQNRYVAKFSQAQRDHFGITDETSPCPNP